MQFQNEIPRSDRYWALSIILLTLAVYAWTSPRGVVLEDDGYFIIAAYYNGVAHPPGYPLYTLLSHLATWFPAGTVAYRVHMFSALCAALACGCVFLIGRHLMKGQLAAGVMALTLAFSGVFWGQAIIAEVYSLNLLLVAAILLIAIKLDNARDNNSRRNMATGMFLLYGLAMSNHWPIVLLSTPMFAAILWMNRNYLFRHAGLLSLYFALGLTPYIWMVIRSRMDPDGSFFGPIESLHEFWFVVSRQAYANIDASVSAGLQDKMEYVLYSIYSVNEQFTVVGAVLIAIGFIYQWRYLKLHISIGLLLGFLFNAIVMALLLGFDYDKLHITIFRVYPLVAYLVCSIWAGLGLYVLFEYLQIHVSQNYRKIVSIGLGFLVPGSVFLANLPGNYRHNDAWAERYSGTILESMPDNSILFLYTDTATGPIGYMNKIEGLRGDVEVYSVAGQVFSNRLYKPFILDFAEIRSRVRAFLHQTDRPVYYIEGLEHGYSWIYYGLFYRVLKDDTGRQRAVALPSILSYLDRINRSGLPYDPWERIHYRTLMEDGCMLTTLVMRHSNDTENTATGLRGLNDRFCDNLLGTYIRIRFLLDNDDMDWTHMMQLLDLGKKYRYQARTKEESARLEYYKGEIFEQRSRPAEARSYYRKSLAVWNHPGNRAHGALERLGQAGQSTHDPRKNK